MADAEKSANPAFTSEQKESFATDKESFHKYRKAIEHDFNKFFGLFMKDSELQKESRKVSVENMEASLKAKPELGEFLIPKWVSLLRLRGHDSYL